VQSGALAFPQDLLEAYPHLTEDDIQAAITYAADTLAHEETVVMEPKGECAFGRVTKPIARAHDFAER